MEELAEITNHPRKRQRNEKEWSRAKEKRRRNSGESKLTFITVPHTHFAVLLYNE